MIERNQFPRTQKLSMRRKMGRYCWKIFLRIQELQVTGTMVWGIYLWRREWFGIYRIQILRLPSNIKVKSLLSVKRSGLAYNENMEVKVSDFF